MKNRGKIGELISNVKGRLGLGKEAPVIAHIETDAAKELVRTDIKNAGTAFANAGVKKGPKQAEQMANTLYEKLQTGSTFEIPNPTMPTNATQAQIAAASNAQKDYLNGLISKIDTDAKQIGQATVSENAQKTGFVITPSATPKAIRDMVAKAPDATIQEIGQKFGINGNIDAKAVHDRIFRSLERHANNPGTPVDLNTLNLSPESKTAMANVVEALAPSIAKSKNMEATFDRANMLLKWTSARDVVARETKAVTDDMARNVPRNERVFNAYTGRLTNDVEAVVNHFRQPNAPAYEILVPSDMAYSYRHALSSSFQRLPGTSGLKSQIVFDANANSSQAKIVIKGSE